MHGAARHGPARRAASASSPSSPTARRRSSTPTSCSSPPAPTPAGHGHGAPDGERILTWQQIYSLDELPERLVVVGSGVTGAELAQAYLGLGSQVVLVSSRDRVLPGEDADAATVIEDVFRKRGMEVLGRSRVAARRAHRRRRRRDASTTAATVEGSHALLAVGLRAATRRDSGLEEVGVELSRLRAHRGRPGLAHVASRGVYAAGDCTGRAAAGVRGGHAGPHRHVARARRRRGAAQRARRVAANVFTEPEIATVGITQNDVDADGSPTSSR